MFGIYIKFTKPKVDSPIMSGSYEGEVSKTIARHMALLGARPELTHSMIHDLSVQSLPIVYVGSATRLGSCRANTGFAVPRREHEKDFKEAVNNSQRDGLELFNRIIAAGGGYQDPTF